MELAWVKLSATKARNEVLKMLLIMPVMMYGSERETVDPCVLRLVDAVGGEQ